MNKLSYRYVLLPVFVVVIIVLGVSVMHADSGPELGCSSKMAATTIDQIVTDAIMHGISPQMADDNINITTDLSVIRTVSATNKKHSCVAVLAADATYKHPPAAAVGPFRFPSTADRNTAGLQQLLETLMTAAKIPDAYAQVIRQASGYTQPKANVGIVLLVNTAVQQAFLTQPGNAQWDGIFQALTATKLYADAVNQDNTAQLAYLKVRDASLNREALLQTAKQQAQSLNGNIAFTIEATDDGQPYVTITQSN